jgi:transcriptional antiterminator Rof (Rho-off)
MKIMNQIEADQSGTVTEILCSDGDAVEFGQTLEYRYISKLPMKNERIWSYVKETTSHLQNKQRGVSLSEVTHSSSLNQDRIHEFPSPMLNIIIRIDFLQVP